MKRMPVKKRRTKPRRGVVKDPLYLAWIHHRRCIAVHSGGCAGPITAHHVRRYGEPKNDNRTVPLCAAHHLHDFGKFSIERLGKAKFEARFNVTLEVEIDRLYLTYMTTSTELVPKSD